MTIAATIAITAAYITNLTSIDMILKGNMINLNGSLMSVQIVRSVVPIII